MSHCQRERGYVLLTVLVFLQLFFSLGIYELNASAKRLQLNWCEHSVDILRQDSLKVLHEVESHQLHTCFVATRTVTEFVNMSLDYWRGLGCYVRGEQDGYYHVSEYLGVDACGGSVPVAYYRVTLIAVQAKQKGVKLILQSVVAEPSSEAAVCEGKPHRVQAGRQMLREL